MKIKVINQSKHPLPEYQTPLAAGLDLRANLDEPVSLEPLERKLIGTGLFIELPAGYEAQIRPRSGLAFKYGLSVLNTPGTVDAGYRGELMVTLFNSSNESFDIVRGDRIAQLVFQKVEHATFIAVTSLPESTRGETGFGSSGRN